MKATPEMEKPPRAGGPLGGFEISHQKRPYYADISACLEDFRGHIQAAYGLALLGDLKADGHWHGLRTDQDKRGAAPFRYCVHLDAPQNVQYQDMKRDVAGAWFPEGQTPLDPVEKERRRLETEAKRAERDRQIAEKHNKTAKWARVLWGRSKPASPDHPYLVRKGVGVHGLRFCAVWERRAYDDQGELVTVRVPGVLLVPMKDPSGAIWNLQAIFQEANPELGRDKDFLGGGRKRGLFHWLGQRTETVCLAEGYSTGATIHEATGYRVFVCFDAGNLPDVAQTVRGLLPDARIVVCADNDEPDKKGRRAGQEKAEQAAALVGGFVALPPVEGADFNDFAAMLREGGGYGQ